MNDPKIIVALDFADPDKALDFSRQVSPKHCRLKVGKELFTCAGPDFVRRLVADGYDVFLDLKFPDIPNTVQRAITAAAGLGIWMVNVHALGGRAMLEAAREGAEISPRRPFLIAVTVLTSMDEQELHWLGIEEPVTQTVQRLTKGALEAGLDGVVCSAREAPALRQTFGQAPLLVTPGIRPDWAASDDQQRIVTPQQALADGASYLVIGRPITRHHNPIEALRQITDTLGSAV